MKVLSLFDGISCARVALERSGINVEAYYSSEIDVNAIRISRKNWPRIVQMGEVQLVGRKHLDIMAGERNAKIDLLIGGSPCQDLSRANTGGKGLKGERSGLFYEYLRVLRALKPTYFVLENVASMKKEHRDEISRELGVQPIMIDATLVSAQIRKRLFWTNIPGVALPVDRGIFLKDILESGYAMDAKARTLTKSYGLKHPQPSKIGSKYEQTMVAFESGFLKKLPDGRLKVLEATKQGYAIAEDGDSVDISYPRSTTRRGRVGKKAKNLMTTPDQICVFTKGEVRPLTAVECERLQSLPDGYTEGVSETQRKAACGNAFNVEVVSHILNHIPR